MTGGLVEHQDPRLPVQGACKKNPLLLPGPRARFPCPPRACCSPSASPRSHRVRPRAARSAPCAHGRAQDRRTRCCPQPSRRTSWSSCMTAPTRSRCTDAPSRRRLDAADQHFAGSGLEQPENDLRERRLAAARGSGDGNRFAGFDAKVHVLQHRQDRCSAKRKLTPRNSIAASAGGLDGGRRVALGARQAPRPQPARRAGPAS